MPSEFSYSEYQTSTFKIALWHKITNPKTAYRIYIEGDGAAFTATGYPSDNPTPHSNLMRLMAAGDTAENVIYLARPCQYITDRLCIDNKYWSSARFSPEILQAEYETITHFAPQQPLTLIGYSGGAQIAGLLAVKYKDLQIQKLITVAGNLDIEAWVKYHKLTPLSLSDDLHNHRREYLLFPQKHFIGLRDTNTIPQITRDYIADTSKLTIIKNASHNSGWEAIFQQIYQE